MCPPWNDWQRADCAVKEIPCTGGCGRSIIPLLFSGATKRLKPSGRTGLVVETRLNASRQRLSEDVKEIPWTVAQGGPPDSALKPRSWRGGLVSEAGFEPAPRGLFCSLLEFSTCVFTFRHSLEKDDLPDSSVVSQLPDTHTVSWRTAVHGASTTLGPSGVKSVSAPGCRPAIDLPWKVENGKEQNW